MDLNDVKELLCESSVTCVSTIAVLFLGILYFLLKRKNLPPGPTGLPVLGYWPFLKHEETHFQLTDMKKKYGDVYSFSVTGKLFIHLGSIKSIKEAHVTKADCFDARFTDYSIVFLLFDNGMALASGEKWKVLRKFFVQAFREYGMTSVKDYMAGPIYDSINSSVESLMSAKGKPVNIVKILNDPSAEILRRMMFNDGEITDEELGGIILNYQDVLAIFSGRNLLLMGQFAKYFIFPRVQGFETASNSLKKMKDYMRTLIKRHEQTYKEDNIRDIVDSFIKQRRDRLKKGDPTSEYFTEESLIGSLLQFVGDGILATAIFIAYFMHALLEYPEEQEKIYKELEDVIGGRQITLEDRKNLPYTNAFMQEVMRTTDFLPYSPSLLCTKETSLNGYTIPKGAITVMNLWAAHRDPDVFDEPDAFKPTRYVNQPDKPKTEPPLIFGAGKRSCTGESFTMTQVFLFLTNIVKHFRLERSKGDNKKSFLDGHMEVCAYARN